MTITALTWSRSDLTEGMILTHIQRFDRRMLHGMAQQAKTKLLASNATATSDGNPSGTTPQSNVPTPPADAASASVNEMHSKLQDTFLDLSAGIEKVFQLYRSAQDVLYLHGLKEHLPTFASKIGGASGPLGQAPADQMSEPARPWTFAFGIDTTVSYTSIGQLVCFGRAMLEEMAVQSQLEWRPEWEASDASH